MNEQLKSYKTVEQIAKKHRMDVSDIQKQLDMGVPIEHEHTKNHKLAMEIALQHLDEIPDYYTRLKKMEASAKKEHKKFKDVKESLRDWFGKSESIGKKRKPGWVEVISGEPCAREEGEEDETPKCVSSDKRASMTKSQRISAQRRKSAADPNQPEKSGAAKPTYVSTDSPKKKMNEESDVKGKGSGTKDACYTKVKSRYSVWPSAYASGALVKCRKVGAANWGNKSESINLSSKDSISEEMGMRYCPKCEKDETRDVCRYGPKYWDMFSLPSRLSPNQMKFSIAQVHPANESKEPDHEYSMARSELSTIISAAKRLRGKLNGEGNIEAWVQSKITKAADYIDAAADYLDSGESKVNEDATIEDADGNTFIQIIDIIKANRLMKEGISFDVGKPSRGAGALTPDAAAQLGPKAVDLQKKKAAAVSLPSTIGVKLADSYKLKTLGQFMSEAKKSEMKCNSPKSEPVGDSLTGKSHVVKACEGGKEKLIRFGQRGVKGSPKKKGESKEYASRRNRFQTRHAKNIAKGKMSAAYWANKVKW